MESRGASLAGRYWNSGEDWVPLAEIEDDAEAVFV